MSTRILKAPGSDDLILPNGGYLKDDGTLKVSKLQIDSGDLNVDNLKLDGNTISSTDTNGDIILTPDGSGKLKTDNAVVGMLGIPVGVVLPWIGGYFGNSSNGSFTNVLGNSVANVNTLLNAYGFYVCDGSALNDADSPIFNGSSRYLPNLTDDRFLMGDTTAGGIGGSSLNSHTHTTTLIEANLPSHNHSVSITTSSDNNHTHGATGLAINAEGSHTHGISITTSSDNNHTHSATGLSIGGEGAHTHTIPRVYGTNGSGSNSGISDNKIYAGPSLTTSAGSSHTHGITGNTASAPAHSHSVSGTSASGSSHTHGITGNTASVPAHSHSVSGNTGSIGSGTAATTSVPSDTENRPKYLSCFYIMKIK